MSDAQFPAKLAFLFEPSRYKVLWGGRGSGKSVGIARALLIQGATTKHRILCCRELQNSIRDSVHKLLVDEMEAIGLTDFYTVTQTSITGQNGTEFIFRGLRHAVTEVKSTQGLTRVWVEEAQVVSRQSWAVLIPTVREPDSEIWVSFNPELDTDETYVRFILNPPPNAKVVKMNWSDNPFFPNVLRDEMIHLKETDPDAWLTVYEGHTRQTLDGAIFAKEIREATEEGRITRVKYDPSKPVQTFWDLGKRDHTAIWFAQIIGFDFRVIGFYQNRGERLDHYIQEVQRRGWVYGDMWLPHDAAHDRLGMQRTIEQQMRDAGYTVRITPNIRKADQLNAARTLFPNVYFDQEACGDGLSCLRRYRFAVDPDTGQFSKDPLHDDASDGADAFLYLAVALRERRKPKFEVPKPRFIAHGPGGWMR